MIFHDLGTVRQFLGRSGAIAQMFPRPSLLLQRTAGYFQLTTGSLMQNGLAEGVWGYPGCGINNGRPGSYI